ncbi:MerR family transcriptional regulator [Ornithinibacillus sp. L9]|uniref:MerR family transcriptional regulator n=1 Tax=Ornithinibacillus caprae TaxID=2678566 RepID=A0A6N8FKJ4_9BACI|nr:MerR family transcriptional regulator [Ornithinibacillus caprae]MUK89236.1 MerR family transcriptional regulator [Ornithinibacillus caprae]
MYYKPIEIARSLDITPSALRHYEAWGIVPAPKRKKNGYRLYTEEHVAYFRCIRAMYPGFGMDITRTVMKYIQDNKTAEAFWTVNKEQAKLQQEKVLTDQTHELLQESFVSTLPETFSKEKMTIGYISKLADVPASAIRHWEKEGLITPERDPENGYRLFNQMHLRQILVIRALRRTVHYLEIMKNIVKEIEHNNIEEAKKATKEALENINFQNRNQFHGICELYKLCEVLDLV